MTQVKAKERLFGKLIVDFANAETIKKAMELLVDNMLNAFDISPEFLKSQLAELSVPEYKILEPYLSILDNESLLPYTEIHLMDLIDKIKKRSKSLLPIDVHNALAMEIERRYLKHTLSQVVQRNNLRKISSMGFFIDVFNLIPKQDHVIDENGSIIEAPIFRENYMNPFSNGEGFRDVIAYCLIMFLKVQKLRDLLHSCEECGKYFISKRVRKKDERKFCGSKCRLALHNRKRIESGKHAEYKRKKRKEGAKASYYG